MLKKVLINAAKVSVAAVIFYFILREQDLETVWNDLQAIQPIYFIAACCIYASVFYIFGHRWAFINRIFTISLPVTELWKHHMIAFFFSNGLPSTIGGDFWRIKYLINHTDRKTKAFFIPLLERYAGFIATYLIGIFSFIAFAEIIDIETSGLIVISAIAVITIVLIFSPAFYRILTHILTRYRHKPIIEKIIGMIETISIIQHHRLTFTGAVLLSGLVQLMYAIACVLIVHSLNESINIGIMLLIVPIVYFISIIPISINGLGLREAVFVTGLTAFGIQSENAFAISIMIFLMQILVSLIGGVLFLTQKSKVKSHEASVHHMD